MTSDLRPDPWPWPDDLDGPIAAPGIHRVVFENDRVRVVETLIKVGERTPVHTHAAGTLSYVISGSHLVRRDEHGSVVLDTRTVDPPYVMPEVLWSEYLGAHSLENPGPAELRVIGIEVKA